MQNESDSSITLKVSRNAKATINFVYGNLEDKRPFVIMGPLKHKGSYKKHLQDSSDLIVALSKTGQNIYIELKNNRDFETNIITMPHWADENKARLKYIQRGIKDLIDLKMLCIPTDFKEYLFKPEKHTYMFNPYFIKCNSYYKAIEFWEHFTGFTKNEFY